MKNHEESESSATNEALANDDTTSGISLKNENKKANNLPYLGPNISLSFEQSSKEPPESTSEEEDDPAHTTPSPKPATKAMSRKLSVKERKAKLEENIRNRNKNLRLAKEKSEARRISRACDKSREPKVKEDPFSVFMKV